MIIFPTAKINFGLNIVSKRADGYHNIESIFYPIGAKDSLEITLSKNGKPSLHLYGLPVPGTTADNLVWKAWLKMQAMYQLEPVEINLIKAIPMGGGIGGGSADCGFFINLVDDFFKLNLSVSEKERIALELGSDCPFFIRNVPAFVRGRGEELSEVPSFLKGYTLVLLYGDLHISTAEAYAGISPQPAQTALLTLVDFPEQWKEKVKNDFEPVVFAKYPTLDLLKEELYRNGAVYASLTGTGSCVYGLFKDMEIPSELRKKAVWWGQL